MLVLHLERFSFTNSGCARMLPLALRSMNDLPTPCLPSHPYTPLSTCSNKLETPVDFPLEGLDMGPYQLSRQQPAATAAAGGDGSGSGSGSGGGAPLYDLYAVSNHYGGMGGGHYTVGPGCGMSNGERVCHRSGGCQAEPGIGSLLHRVCLL